MIHGTQEVQIGVVIGKMKVLCDYCGSLIDEDDIDCNYCGAKNNGYKKNNTPKTIEELKSWYNSLNLPSTEITRIFIDEDYKKPKAFGIYKDNNRYIVYMNNLEGKRIIRYDGADESYAVNELYLKIKEILSKVKR